jgi:hypothetical protein
MKPKNQILCAKQWFPQIDDGVPGDIPEDYRRGHVHADNLQHDHDESEEGPTSAHSQAETRHHA